MPCRVKIDSTLGDRFEKQCTTAKKRAGRKLVTAFLKDQKRHVKQAFPKSGKRRLSAIKGYVSPHGNHVNLCDYSPGATAHETGATIKPKKGKFLALKWRWAWNGASYGNYGKEQSNLQDLMKAGDTFIIKKGNRAIVMRKANAASAKRTRQAKKAGDIERTEHGDAFPIATLIRSVKLPARLHMVAAVKKQLPAYAKNIADEIIKAN